MSGDLALQKEIVIDFNLITESYLNMFAADVRLLLNVLFTGSYFPVRVRGSKSEVSAFTRALAGEKRYITSLHQYGLNNPKTYRDKFKLDAAVKSFEAETGLRWPFK